VRRAVGKPHHEFRNGLNGLVEFCEPDRDFASIYGANSERRPRLRNSVQQKVTLQAHKPDRAFARLYNRR
jgi:hypothetical protein